MANLAKNLTERLLPYVGIIACSLSCTGPDDIHPNCDKYYLHSIKEFTGSNAGPTVGVYYNLEGLVSELKLEADPMLFIEGTTLTRLEYNENRLLKSIRSSGYGLDYYYDHENRVDYILEYYNGVSRDSITQDYNPENLISAITYYDRISQEQVRRREYEYTGKNSTVLRYYEKELSSPGEPPLIATILFEFDTNRLPDPTETWSYAFLFVHDPMAENNITKKTLKVNGQPDNVWEFSYEYNNQGYPTERRSNTGHKTKYRYTCKPRFENPPL